VVEVTHQTQSQNLKQFKKEFAYDPVFVQSVLPGDIPASFQVKLKNAQTDAGPVTAAVTGMPGVDSVGDDSSILQNFYKLLDGARNSVIVVAIILIIAAILLVANTIRLVGVQPAQGDGHYAAGWRVELLCSAAVPRRGRDRGPVRLARGLPACWLARRRALTGCKLLPVPRPASISDLIEVVVVTMFIGLLLCGTTSFLTLRRYLRV
jgi:cell division transport system permease protein